MFPSSYNTQTSTLQSVNNIEHAHIENVWLKVNYMCCGSQLVSHKRRGPKVNQFIPNHHVFPL